MAVFELHFFVRHYGAPPQKNLSSIVEILFPHILIDAKSALLLLVVTHVRHGMPHDNNKENKVHGRLIFLNLQQNGIPRIKEHVQNATFVLTRRTNVCTHHNLSDFLPKQCQWFRSLSEKEGQVMLFDFQGQKDQLRSRIWGYFGPPAQAGSIF